MVTGARLFGSEMNALHCDRARSSQETGATLQDALAAATWMGISDGSEMASMGGEIGYAHRGHASPQHLLLTTRRHHTTTSSTRGRGRLHPANGTCKTVWEGEGGGGVA